MSNGAAARTRPPRLMSANVSSSRAGSLSASPAVHAIWLSFVFPDYVAASSRSVRFCSKASLLDRSQTRVVTGFRCSRSGYVDCSLAAVLLSFVWFELESITSAPRSMAASAMQKPIPDVPPSTSTRFPWSFPRYLRFWRDIVIEWNCRQMMQRGKGSNQEKTETIYSMVGLWRAFNSVAC